MGVFFRPPSVNVSSAVANAALADYNKSMTTVLETSTVPGVRSLYRLAVVLAAVSGTFCVLFLTVLMWNYHGSISLNASQGETTNIATQYPSYRLPADDSFNRLPTDYQSFLALRQELAKDRQNEHLQAKIRQLDHELRINYFKRRDIAAQTTYFLLASSILFFATLRTVTTLKRKIPDPAETARQSGAAVSWRFTVVLAWLMLFGGLYAGLLLAPAPDIEQIFMNKLVAEAQLAAPPRGASSAAQGTTANIGTPSAAQGTAANIVLTEDLLLQNWVSFRNFDGNGVGFSDAPPTHWNGRTGENIIWQSEVPLPGNSSPVIWEDKLFLSGADADAEKIFCFNRADGTLLWTADVTRPEAKLAHEIYKDTGYAAPTPVVDGRHVYAMFANGELVAVDFSGDLVWRKSFGTPDSSYGFASSPTLYFDRLIVQFDDGDGIDDDASGINSKLLALNLNDGSVIWETPREETPNSWSSPTIKKIGDSYQIITCADPYAIAYNPEDGKEIWRVRCLGGDVGPSAVSLGNVVIITNEHPRTTAIDATGSGDVTDTHILWVGANALPPSVSPLATEQYFITLGDYGYLTGYDPTVIGTRNRARFWELEVGDGGASSFYSSPLRVGSLVYAFDKTEDNARAFVIDLSKIAVDDDGRLTEASEKAMIVAVNPMPEPVVTSPAVLNNRLYIRSFGKIYCIGEQ